MTYKILIMVILTILIGVTQQNFEISNAQISTLLPRDNVKAYEDWIKFKNSIIFKERVKAGQPVSFSPGELSYWQSLIKFNLVFLILGGISFVFCLSFSILRICFGKCKGPLSIKKIDKGYKIGTWILLILSLITFCIVYGLIIYPSIKHG